jgi:hypothetical protein
MALETRTLVENRTPINEIAVTLAKLVAPQ